MRGWMPSLVIGLVAAVVVGWIMKSLVGSDGITSIWVAALLSAGIAVVLRLLLGTFMFSDD